MNRITQITGVLAVVMMFSASGAFAAESKCGTIPNPPDLPADGAALASKDMDAVAAAYDEYEGAFSKFNKCAVEEFNAVQKGFGDLVDAYAAKGKKPAEEKKK
jgi:hypothetical protein